MVGAGPAGLSCAHRLALKGIDVTIYDARSKAGGLNEYGIAAYKSTNDFAAKEVAWLLSIGGITIENNKTLGVDMTLDGLSSDFDAVFLSVGLGGVNALSMSSEDDPCMSDAVGFIETLRQTTDLASIPIGRNVVVIGGGMTAVDAAVQSKLLGAEQVTIAYRRGREAMSASRYEQDLAASHGVKLLFNVQPVTLETLGTKRGACPGIYGDKRRSIDRFRGDHAYLCGSSIFCHWSNTCH